MAEQMAEYSLYAVSSMGRIGVKLKLEDFDTLGSKIPLLLNLMPSGKYLMEDFYYAGGLPVILNELKEQLHKNVVTVTGKNHDENISGQTNCYNENVIAKYRSPFQT